MGRQENQSSSDAEAPMVQVPIELTPYSSINSPPVQFVALPQAPAVRYYQMPPSDLHIDVHEPLLKKDKKEKKEKKEKKDKKQKVVKEKTVIIKKKRSCCCMLCCLLCCCFLVLAAVAGGLVGGAWAECAKQNHSQTLSFSANVTENATLLISAHWSTIHIMTGDSSTLDITVDRQSSALASLSDEDFKFNSQNGIITLSEDVLTSTWWKGGLCQTNNVFVYLPVNVTSWITIKATNENGDVNFAGVGNVERLILATTNGEINMDNNGFFVGSLDASTTNGNVNINNLNITDTLRAASTNGDISLASAEVGDTDLFVSTTNGDISVNLYGFNGMFSARTTAGSIYSDIDSANSNSINYLVNDEFDIEAIVGEGTSFLNVGTTNGKCSIFLF